MHPLNDPATSGAYLALGIGLITAFLGLRQWYEWRARDPDLSESDRRHFRGQDPRRVAGAVLLLCIAVEIWAGSRIPHRLGNRPSGWFLAIWLNVGINLLILLALAAVDLVDNRRYARRQRRSMIAERLRLLREARRSSSGGPSDQSPESSQHNE
jgi:hypothetical protein